MSEEHTRTTMLQDYENANINTSIHIQNVTNIYKYSKLRKQLSKVFKSKKEIYKEQVVIN